MNDELKQFWTGTAIGLVCNHQPQSKKETDSAVTAVRE